MIEVIRNPRRKKRPHRPRWIIIAATIALMILRLPGCTGIESLCWTANANKTCPSILNLTRKQNPPV